MGAQAPCGHELAVMQVEVLSGHLHITTVKAKGAPGGPGTVLTPNVAGPSGAPILQGITQKPEEAYISGTWPGAQAYEPAIGPMPFPYSSLVWRLGDRLGGSRHSFLPSFSPSSLPPTVPLCQASSSLWGASVLRKSPCGATLSGSQNTNKP